LRILILGLQQSLEFISDRTIAPSDLISNKKDD
jgi:hypothetical protein